MTIRLACQFLLARTDSSSLNDGTDSVPSPSLVQFFMNHEEFTYE